MLVLALLLTTVVNEWNQTSLQKIDTVLWCQSLVCRIVAIMCWFCFQCTYYGHIIIMGW